jgi:uncharacterized protein YcbK (DUF882 family)
MSDRDVLTPPSRRRQFLTTAAGAAALLLLRGRSGWADAPATNGRRALAFLNTHTGESVSAVYWADGDYRAEGLAAIDRVLRDHRTGAIRPIDRRLLDMLHALRRDIGTSAPFNVISCYRSPRSNAALRQAGRAVAENSLHMEGKAADVRLPGVALADLHRAAVGLRAGGVGYYAGPSFVHVDVGRVRYW